jgi:hypothetical protein
MFKLWTGKFRDGSKFRVGAENVMCLVHPVCLYLTCIVTNSIQQYVQERTPTEISPSNATRCSKPYSMLMNNCKLQNLAASHSLLVVTHYLHCLAPRFQQDKSQLALFNWCFCLICVVEKKKRIAVSVKTWNTKEECYSNIWEFLFKFELLSIPYKNKINRNSNSWSLLLYELPPLSIHGSSHYMMMIRTPTWT